MGDILNEAYGLVQCLECPWYKSCVLPMRFSEEDIRRQLALSPEVNQESLSDTTLQILSLQWLAPPRILFSKVALFLFERLRLST